MKSHAFTDSSTAAGRGTDAVIKKLLSLVDASFVFLQQLYSERSAIDFMILFNLVLLFLVRKSTADKMRLYHAATRLVDRLKLPIIIPSIRR